MIKSMTGFGKAVKNLDKVTITIEVRSVNSKSADINLRIPSIYRNYEIEIRNELMKQLERGKIDLSLNFEKQEVESGLEINIPLAKKYHAQLKQLASELNENFENGLDQVLRMPDVLKSERKEANEEEWKLIKEVLQEAIQALDNFRKTEGESLQKDFEVRLHAINSHLEQIKTLDTLRLQTIKDRIKSNLFEAIGKDKIDENRLEQELIYYIEKLDINEEKVRLKTHLDYFVSTMKEAGAGRKLNFISQEIGREINTIGSKSNDANMQKLVVLMKDELEKIKEQSSNVL
jgi:uncharacterized protein (TIGR00255 family)